MAKNIIQTDEVLNEIEIEKIKLFNDDPLMKEAVRKVMLLGLYNQGTLRRGEPSNPLRNAAFSLLVSENGIRPVENDVLGQELRGMVEGIQALELAFIKLSRYSDKAPKKTKDDETGE